MLQLYHYLPLQKKSKEEKKTLTRTHQSLMITYDKSKSALNKSISVNYLLKKDLKKGLAVITGGHYFMRNQLAKSNLISGIEFNRNSNGIRLYKNIGTNECAHSYIFKGWLWLSKPIKIILRNDFTSGNNSTRVLTSYSNNDYSFRLKSWVTKKSLLSFGSRLILYDNEYRLKHNEQPFAYTKAERTVTFIPYLFPLFTNHNYIHYEASCTVNYSLGYFKSLDGIGMNIGYRNKGFSIEIPLLVLNPIDKPDMGIASLVMRFIAEICLFQLLHYCTSCLTKVINSKLSAYQSDYYLKDRNDLLESISKSKQIQHLLNAQAKKITESQSAKESNGLVIEYALYGKKAILDSIMNRNTWNQAHINEIISDMSNEVIDVTTSSIYLIKDSSNSSTAYFNDIPSIIGFVNPLLSDKALPYFLLKYQYNRIPYISLHKSTESFIIPNDNL